MTTDLSGADLAAIPEVYATAWIALHGNLAIERGDPVMIRGATEVLIDDGRLAPQVRAPADESPLHNHYPAGDPLFMAARKTTKGGLISLARWSTRRYTYVP